MKTKSFVLRPTLTYSIITSLPLIVLSLIFYLGLYALEKYLKPLNIDIVVYIKYFAFFPLVVALYNILYWHLVKYEISATQITFTRGVFTIKEDYLELFRVKDFEKVQPFILRLFNIMNLSLTTSDPTHPTFIFKGVPHSNIPEVLRELVQLARKKNSVLEID